VDPLRLQGELVGGRERHVIGHYGLGEALESDRAYLFGGDASLQRDIDALTERKGVPAPVRHRASDLSRTWRAALCYPSEDGYPELVTIEWPDHRWHLG
jgi:hypothetical protein